MQPKQDLWGNRLMGKDGANWLSNRSSAGDFTHSEGVVGPA